MTDAKLFPAEDPETLRQKCLSACETAALIYNERAPMLRIIPLSIAAVSVSSSERTITCRMQLMYESGAQPEEEFDENDLRDIEQGYGSVLDPILREIGLSYTLAKIIVPDSYYSS